jgi:hypothetical protein
MQEVKSSSIRAIGYNKSSEELWVEYRSGPGAYVYKGVPGELFTGLRQAGSKGSYVNRMIKGRFPYEYRPDTLGGRASRRRKIG